MAELWWGLGMLLGVEGELWVWKESCGCERGAVGVEGELRLVMAGNRLWQRRETGTAGSRCRACHMTFV